MQRLDHAARDRVELDPARGFHEHHEFVAAHAADRVHSAHRRLEAFGHRRQDLVAGVPSETLDDVREPVDVDHQRSREHARLAPPARDHALGAVERERAVGQAGEAVVQLLGLAIGGRADRLIAPATRIREQREGAHQEAEQGAADEERR